MAGRWTDADDGATFDVTNPATDEVVGSVPDLGPAETRRAVAAAAHCQTTWQTTTAKVRPTARPPPDHCRCTSHR